MNPDPELLQHLPDVPRWVAARAMLLAGAGEVFRAGGGWVVRSDALAVAVGRPGREALGRALEHSPCAELLTAIEDEAATAAALPGWSHERARICTLAVPEALAPEDRRVRLLAPSNDLSHLPAELRAELARAGEVHALFAGGTAASFAYACWRTERHFDLSVDTVAELRRRGFARSVASALVRAELEGGRRPVWGALASNVASRRLAEGLGFEETDQLTVFSR